MTNYTIDDCVINIDYGHEATGMTVWKWNDKRRDYDTVIESRFSGYALFDLIMLAESEVHGESEGAWCAALDIAMPDDLD